MLNKSKVSIENLKNTCSLESVNFSTTKDLIPLGPEIIGQKRASEAIQFGLSVKNKGYNIFVAGASGTGRNSYVKHIAKYFSRNLSIPDDWIYIYNFKNPYTPMSINLKAGLGKEFSKDMENTIKLLKKDIKKIFHSKEYQRAKTSISQEYENYINNLIEELNVIGPNYGFIFTNTEQGILSLPLKDSEPMTEEDINKLSDDEIESIRIQSDKLTIETTDIFSDLKNKDAYIKLKFKELDEETVINLIDFYIDPLKEKYSSSPKTTEYFNMVSQDILKNIAVFKGNKEQEGYEEFFLRYKVNLFIDNSSLDKAPVIFESNAAYHNLLGRIEYKNEMGIMKTDFTQIKPGSIHEANGGYLVLQAKDILSNSATWTSLKRMLTNNKSLIDDLNRPLNYIISGTLKPESIPLNLKVIIIGSHYAYNALYSHDEDFRKLFKIMADYDTQMVRNKNNSIKMARFIASHCEKKNLRHFTKEAVEKIIEHSSRLADHKQKLSARFNSIVEILYEANTWAEFDNSPIVEKSHVKKAIEQKMYRNGIYEEKIFEMFESEDILLNVDGKRVGEINGLAVVGVGDYSFGKPSKITVSTYRGRAGIINIEREVESSGRIHDKGVMIISGYLGHKYAQDKPLAISASIVFEQLYSGVDGDSASSTELYAILSSISEVPIKQSIAVTGSVNQRGEIQPIGGVNEKIEGFYKICKLKGLTGEQGVMIPHQNVKNLMLSDEVIGAVKNGMFHIYSVKTINEGIQILTGVEAGEKNDLGEYPEGSIHYLVNEKLSELAEAERLKKAEA
ncbi:MAG: AAA family ATPase [Anaeromicrobium sp.]|jgi:lon-related putative ATP-dependent protease|uniref:ATP-binding protein n=1 Tax=Anaeromicrobium sp. TaxID=1929132 RepID=UPI0025E2CE93|nr:ATP-binding protein [Anaeromicrobium sp.]MCT4593602.1 AAA family ATPase [Anaeromicrobium sp.]